MEKRKTEIRIIELSINVINELKGFYKTPGAEHLYSQVVRSVSSAALNYSEALSAESTKDFTHKLSITLKELRETYTNLRIVKGINPLKDATVIDQVLDECNQLIVIMTSSIKTLKGVGRAKPTTQSNHTPDSNSDSNSN